ncbi:iron chelate uptake ABC transporter family permease subunit [Intrasporangium sp.]|uniref:iron chelate uptake ABC transporter family permease subunit n=1 Tax=Intrasporangium sp. TaxID=1925024 RepID=UPI0032214504
MSAELAPAPESSPRLSGRAGPDAAWLPAARRRLALLGGTVLLVVTGFLTLGVSGSWAFVLERRASTLATMVVVAVAIAVSTVVFHTLTTNHILTPGVMGFDSLYILVQTVGVLVWGTTWTTSIGDVPRFGLETLLLLGFALPVLRWVFVTRRHSIELVVLMGIVAGGLFRAGSGFLQRIMDPSQFIVLQDTFFADFNSASPALLATCAAVVGAIGVVVWRDRHTLDVLSLGRESATALGVDHRRVMMRHLVLVTVLVSASTVLVGPSTFFGLLVVHVGYRIVRTHRHVVTLPAAALTGIVCLVGGQLLFERVLGFEGSLSMIVEFLGGLTFIALFLRRARA